MCCPSCLACASLQGAQVVAGLASNLPCLGHVYTKKLFTSTWNSDSPWHQVLVLLVTPTAYSHFLQIFALMFTFLWRPPLDFLCQLPIPQLYPNLSITLYFFIWCSSPSIRLHVLCCVQSLSHVWLLAILWTITCQAPLSMRFSRWEYWNGFPIPPQGDLSDPGIESTSLALADGFFTTVPPGKPIRLHFCLFSVFLNPQKLHGDKDF